MIKKILQIPNVLDSIFPSQRRIEQYISFCERQPVLIFLLIVLFSILGGWGTIRLYSNIDTSLTALLPDYYTSVKTLKQIDQEGVKQFESLFATGNNTDELIRFAEETKRTLEELPEIDHVDIKFEEIIPKKYAFLTLDREKLESIRDRIQKKIAQAKLKRSGFFISLLDEDDTAQQPEDDLELPDVRELYPQLMIKEGTKEQYFLSRDEKVIKISIFPALPPSDFRFAEQFYRVIPQALSKVKQNYPDLKTYNYGPYRKRLDEYRLIRHDVNRIGTLSIFAVIVALILFFRQIIAVVMIVIPLLISLLWTMGFSYLTIGHLNIITAFLIGILTGLGVDYCIHLYSRYLDELKNNVPQREALSIALFRTGRASFTSSINTALVFLSLGAADFRGFSEFGLISGFGLIICYFGIFLMLPFFIVWFQKLGILKPGIRNRMLNCQGSRIPDLIPKSLTRFPFSKPLMFLSGLIVLGFIWIAPSLQFEYDFGKLRADMVSYQKEEALRDRFNLGDSLGSNSAIVVMKSRDDIPFIKKAIDEKIKEDVKTPTIRSFLSFDNAHFSVQLQKERMKVISEIRDLVDQKALRFLKGENRRKVEDLRQYLDVDFYPIEEVPQSIVRFFSPRHAEGERIGTYAYVLARYEIRSKDGKDAMRFSDDVRNIHTDRGVFHASSQEVVFADVLGLMLKESKSTILVAFSLIFFFVWLDFGKLRKTILVVFPLTCGLMLTLILLHSFGGKISFYNMIIIPMIIGMGEDNAVHIYHRYLEEGRGGLCKALKTSGMATWMASITTILGFVGLIFSHHNGLKSMGYMATAGLLGCLVCNLLILPAFVQFFEDRQAKGLEQNH